MVELYILGPAEIKDPQGVIKHSFLNGPKRLALLVYLLLNRPHGFHRRDSLLPLFWPNHGQKSARNSLSNMLHHIRQKVDPNAIANRGTEEVKLQPETIWSDAQAFEQNLQNGMPKKALKLYRGDLLKGFHVPDVSPDLDNWLDHERDRFCRLAYNASITLMEKAEERQDLHAAQRWAKKAAGFKPICEKTHSRLIKLLSRTGNKSEAIQINQEFVNRYKEELEVEPPAELTSLAFEINSKEIETSYIHKNQEDITTHISETLASQLIGNETDAIEQNSTNDLEAFCLHAQGRWSLDKRTEEGIEQAINYFQQALELDPKYMPAWVGIAEARILSIKYRFRPSDTPLIDAEVALGKALILGPNSAETFTTIALLHEVKKDAPAAIQQYLKAITSRPNDANAHNWLGWTYLLIGNSQKALKFTKGAVKLNPLSTDALSNLSLSYLANGEYSKAILESRRIQLLQPERTTGPFLEGVILYHQGQFLEASNKLQDLSVLWAGSGPVITLALTYISMNEKERALIIKNQLSEKHDDFGVAMIHAALGNIEESLHLLLNISEWNYWSVLSIHHLYPKILAPLYADKRFESVKKLALSSYDIYN